jgi:lipid A ethanolaminephosphotransferase
MQQYGVYLDPSMLRNVLRTDWHEAGELLGLSLLHLLLHAVLPLLLLWRVQIVTPALAAGTGDSPGAAAVGRWRAGGGAAGGVPAVFVADAQPQGTALPDHAGQLPVVAGQRGRCRCPRQAPRRARPSGWTPHPARAGPRARKPLLVVLVVGETARAANWGLSATRARPRPAGQAAGDQLCHGHELRHQHRDLAALHVRPVGRRDYDEARIRGSESLLHVLARAGVGVTWRDNQSGCKGVCDGLPTQTVHGHRAPGCATTAAASTKACCTAWTSAAPGQRHAAAGAAPAGQPRPVVLPPLPAGLRALPARACRSDDLRSCSREQIVNAYDNALLYTDHVLARLIEHLQAAGTQVDSALLYVSDHGESLGENNLFLHGLPYAIAPDVQKQVPMVMWFSDGLRPTAALDLACLRAAPRSRRRTTTCSTPCSACWTCARRCTSRTGT